MTPSDPSLNYSLSEMIYVKVAEAVPTWNSMSPPRYRAAGKTLSISVSIFFVVIAQV